MKPAARDFISQDFVGEVNQIPGGKARKSACGLPARRSAL
jgi:hypothetical protein